MIQTALHHSFLKSFDKRIRRNSKLSLQTQTRIELFKQGPNNPLLKDHQLTGNKRGFRSFSITGDIRIVYFLESDGRAIFVDIGSHNQVY